MHCGFWSTQCDIINSKVEVKGVTERGRLRAGCLICVLTGRWLTDDILAKLEMCFKAFACFKTTVPVYDRIYCSFTFCPTQLFLIHKVGKRLRDS